MCIFSKNNKTVGAISVNKGEFNFRYAGFKVSGVTLVACPVGSWPYRSGAQERMD